MPEKLKVLYFASVPMPAVCRRMRISPSYGGWWIWSMLTKLAERSDVQVMFAWGHRGLTEPQHFVEENISYYIFPERGVFTRRSGVVRRLDDELGQFMGLRRDSNAVADAADIVRQAEPDLVHVFGSENRYGLLASVVKPPVVVWIQGILDVYRHHFFGSLPVAARIFQPRLLCTYMRMLANAFREREVFRRCRYFIGRTSWDAAHQHRLKMSGRYFAVQECIRPEFFEEPGWRFGECESRCVYTTTSAAPFKGTELLLRAIAFLRDSLPDVKIRIGGALSRSEPTGRRLHRVVAQLNLQAHVTFLGQLDVGRIVEELRRARAFVLPSFIENSPNSLSEAQLIGTPVVASSVGGSHEMVNDGETGLLFQSGDSALLAHQIGRLLGDDALALRLSSNARRVARHRHAPSDIVESLLSAYRSIVVDPVQEDGTVCTLARAAGQG